jgi:formylglycine-generating enzyme required for sulfatase activity
MAMKKMFAVLAAMLLLVIMACSGKSDSGSIDPNTTQATINSTGGSLQLSDGANVTIPSGVVADNTTVTLTKLPQPQLYATQATAVTNSYQITIPGGSIKDQSGSSNFITFQIPSTTSAVSAAINKMHAHVKAMVSSNASGTLYNVSEVTITNNTNIYALYGGDIGTINVPAGALPSSSNDSITMVVTGIDVTNYFPAVTQYFYDINLQPITSISPQDTGGKIPIILIHGWQIDRDASNPQSIWENFINYFNSNSDLTNKYKLYSFTYDTVNNTIDNDALNLNYIISHLFPSQQVVIIAHSMGGLVAHAYIQSSVYKGSSHVIKLITLGTPYHGTPLVQCLNDSNTANRCAPAGAVIVDIANIWLNLHSVGANELMWDGYPTATTDTTTNSALFNLNNSLNNNPQYASLYTAFAGSNLDLFHGDLDYLYFILNKDGFPSDGIVPLSSAFNDGHPTGFVNIDPPNGEVNYDHSQMAQGKLASTDSSYPDDPLFDKIKSVLVTTAGDYLSPNIGTLKYVPAGSFQRDATPTNISTVSAFRMSQYDITRAQFLAIMGTDPSYTPFSSGTNDPVQQVNWYHTIAFCNKLSIAEGLTPVYSVSGINFTTLNYADIPTTSDTNWDAATANWSANGYRLPTEMEYMWAAMGATSGYGYTSGVYTTGYAKAFAGSTGSNNIGDYAWYSGNNTSTTHPVGTKLPNELGIYDMSGNVWEWNWDWYDTYPTGTQTNYKGAASGTGRVIRGGGRNDPASSASIAYRSDYIPITQYFILGFRVVLPSAVVCSSPMTHYKCSDGSDGTNQNVSPSLYTWTCGTASCSEKKSSGVIEN